MTINDNNVNEIFDVNLKIILERIKKLESLLEETDIYMESSSAYSKFSQEVEKIDIIKNDIKKVFNNTDISKEKLSRFSMVIYYFIRTLENYIYSISNKKINFNNKIVRVLDLNNEHIQKISSYIQALESCIQKVNE